MKNRVMIIAIVALTVAAGLAFAEGSRETDDQAWGPRGRMRPQLAEETTELTGQVFFDQDAWHPVLKSGGEQYTLMAPRWQTDGLDVADGATITVEGYLMEDHPRFDVDGPALMVTRAVIDGKEYEVESYGGRPGPMMGGPGMRPGMRGGRGGGAPRQGAPRGWSQQNGA